ncbi:hypothetical protein ACGFI3_04775 [Nonomuraea wenchangensis]|uniref:nSTAND3 domain-containing NTPase n=1 Tax=Nonomuraea wenchangensis TaxID=568860 RepID=UPI00371BA88F
MCKSYILLSNARISGTSEEKIRTALLNRGVEYPLILGGQWLNQTIASYGNLRMLVPRVYGLGDLSYILDERAHAQARSLLSYLKYDLDRMVVTDAYRRAAQAVSEHGFVLLLGEPCVGKSLIAATLAMTAIDNWGCVTFKADSPSEVVDRWNPHERNQFIWMDDAFGVLRHDRILTEEWVRRLPKLMTAVHGGAKIVLTSRDYVYRHARPHLKEYAYPILRERQVIVEVEELSQAERRQILYNHIRLGNQPLEAKRRLKPFLEEVADVTPFRPEVARRLGDREFTAGMDFTLRQATHFMKHPTSFLRDVYAQLEAPHQAALMLVQSADRLPIPVILNQAQQSTLKAFGVSEAEAVSALRALDGTFLRQTAFDAPEKNGWTFRHPSLREGFAAYIDDDIHRIVMFLSSISDRELLAQVDCGSEADQGTLVVIPQILYHQVAERLSACKPRYGDNTEESLSWCEFLNSRTSPEFLRIYLQLDPDLGSSLINFVSTAANAPKQRLLIRLQKLGLLTELQRRAVVNYLIFRAVEIPDSSWLDYPEWRELFNAVEILHIGEEVKASLLSTIDTTINNWRLARPGDENPHTYYEPLMEALTRYQQEYRGDDYSVDRIDEALNSISELADSEYEDYQVEASALEYEDFEDREDRSYQEQPFSNPYTDAASSATARPSGAGRSSERSVFDDVDT